MSPNNSIERTPQKLRVWGTLALLAASYVQRWAYEMKHRYLVLHLIAIPGWLLLTYLAFVMFLPSYLVVVFVGFDLWQKFVDRKATHRFYWATLIGVIQTLMFICLAVAELTLFGLPLGPEQLSLVAHFGMYFLVGFALIAIFTSVSGKSGVSVP
jgi:hypothetical protein